MIQSAERREIHLPLIECPDRLARFGYEYPLLRRDV